MFRRSSSLRFRARRRGGVVVAGAVTVLAAAITTACSTADADGAGSAPRSSSPAASPTGTGATGDVGTTGGGPQPPEKGAWIGAWVKPSVDTPEGRMAAAADFDTKLGRKVDVQHNYHKWDDDFPDIDDKAWAADGKIPLLSWAGTDTRAIQSGRYDALIRERARAIKAWGVPVLLEWRWEMDRPNLQAEIWSPQDYIAAWKHIRGIFTAEQVTNVAWVWCPLAVGFVDGRAQPFYPGDDSVDWLCADTYPGKTIKSFEEAIGPFLDWAADHPRPIIIGEFGMKQERGEERRQQWLRDVRTFVKTRPQIKGLVYFDSDRTDVKPVYNMSLRDAPESMAVFREMAADPYFNVRGR